MAVRDYESLKTEYVLSEKSLREVAEDHSLPVGTVKRVGWANGWAQERETVRGELIREVREEAMQTIKKHRITALELCDAIIADFMEKRQRGGNKVTAYDALNAARLKTVLEGGVDSRSESKSLSVTAAIGDLAAAAGVDVSDVRRRLIAELSAAEHAVDSGAQAQQDQGEAGEAAQASHNAAGG